MGTNISLMTLYYCQALHLGRVIVLCTNSYESKIDVTIRRATRAEPPSSVSSLERSLTAAMHALVPVHLMPA